MRSESKEQEHLLSRLLGLDAEEILPRISQGDPLGVQLVCMRCLREEALVLDPERALSRALVEIALDVSLAREGDLRGGWLQRSVDRALAWLLQKDHEAQRNGEDVRNPESYAYVRDAFAIEESESRRATVDFNALPTRARQAFFFLLIDGMSVADCLDLGLWEPEELRLDIWGALSALGHVTAEEVEAFRNRKKQR